MFSRKCFANEKADQQKENEATATVAIGGSAGAAAVLTNLIPSIWYHDTEQSERIDFGYSLLQKEIIMATAQLGLSKLAIAENRSVKYAVLDKVTTDGKKKSTRGVLTALPMPEGVADAGESYSFSLWGRVVDEATAAVLPKASIVPLLSPSPPVCNALQDDGEQNTVPENQWPNLYIENRNNLEKSSTSLGWYILVPKPTKPPAAKKGESPQPAPPVVTTHHMTYVPFPIKLEGQTLEYKRPVMIPSMLSE